MYDPIAIANHFLDLGKQDKIGIDPLKLQKILFIAHGWHLAVHNTALVREPVGVWKFGPVIESVYHEFKRFGSAPITEKGTRPYKFDRETVVFYEPEIGSHEKNLREFLGRVWEGYNKYTGLQLTYITHRPGTPWSDAKNLGMPQIPSEIIRNYYKLKVKKPPEVEQDGSVGRTP